MAFDDDYAALKTAVANYLKRGDLTTQIPDFIHLAERRIERKINFVPNSNDTWTSSATLTAAQAYIYAPVGCIEPIFLRLETDPIREMNVVSHREFARLQQANTSGIPSAIIPMGMGRTGSIIGVISGGVGLSTVASSVAHGISTGARVAISGTADYNGSHTISAASAAIFNIPVTWTSTQTGTWESYQQHILFDEAPSSASDYTLFYKARFDYLRDGLTTETTWLLHNFPEVLLYGSLLEAEPYIKNDQRTALWAAMFKEAVDDIKRAQWRKRAGGGELRVRPDVPLV